MIVIDTNNNVSQHLAFLKAKGVGAVGRYYSSSSVSKRLGPQEALALSRAGMKIFVVFEDNGDPVLTQADGRHHAQTASTEAQRVGQPPGSAIYFALEHLPNGYTSADIPAVRTYMQGVNDVLAGLYKIGVYSDGVICQALLDSNLCTYTWLSASSSFAGTKAFYRSNRWSLAQDANIDRNWNGLSIDTNEAQADFGAFEIGAGPLAVFAADVADTLLVEQGTFTVRRGHRYRATVKLFGLEQLAGNAMVAERLEKIGFVDVSVSGSGSARQAEATWPGSDTSAQIDSHISNIVEIA